MADIGADIAFLRSQGFLKELLKDKTTKKNITWATDAYGAIGHKYERDGEILPELISGVNTGVIETRAKKDASRQNERTRRRAEVFTPLWIVRKMNDFADEEWFGYPDVFFKNGEPTPQARFFEQKNTWRDYVDSRRLEITCGEAPFLTTRYDPETGEDVLLPARVGILDRKMRVVNENAADADEWIEWAFRALEATYGYEFQGDSLLIARVNFVMCFRENLAARWGREPSAEEWQRAAKIAAWNIWQMDGLTGTVPFRKAADAAPQVSMFDLFGVGEELRPEEGQPLCRVYDWRARSSAEYLSLKSGS